MCFSSKKSAGPSTGKDATTPSMPNPNNAPAANPTQPSSRPISSTANDPLGQSQLGS